MRLFGPDAGHLIERRVALITAAEVCLAIDMIHVLFLLELYLLCMDALQS